MYEELAQEEVAVVAWNRSVCNLCGVAGESEYRGPEICANGLHESDYP